MEEPWELEWSEVEHRTAVERVREEIAAGTTYQCNLTTRFRSHLRGDALAYYLDLVSRQGGEYNAFLDAGDGRTVLSASPELFFERRGDLLRMRPMKGTAPRGRTTVEDRDAVDCLLASAKERAENIMIVDLVRNDLGRIARPGSVTTPRLLHPERLGTVHQLTSDVEATAVPGVGLTEVFRALFPCGSVTGAPKASTMRLIAELEDSPRGVYCGAIGWVAPPDQEVRARFSVAIRTVQTAPGDDAGLLAARYGTGGGVTWSSDAAAEYAELRAKARVLEERPTDFDLLETMRFARPDGAGRTVDPGELAGLRSADAHLARLADSAAYFDVPFSGAAARELLAERLSGVASARVRLACGRAGDLRVDLAPLPEPPTGELRVAIDPEPIDSTRCWPHHKTSLREPYETRRGRHPGVDEVLLVNERGEITEACTANVAVRLGGRWWTPPLGDGCLPGIERARLVASGDLSERVLRPDDVRGAEGLALVNSLRGWRPCRLA